MESPITQETFNREKLEKLDADAFSRNARLAFSRVVAEGGSQLGSLGAILIAKKIVPEQTDTLKNMLASAVVKPRIAEFDAFLDKYPSIEPGGTSDTRKAMDEEHRAKYIAGLMVDFGVMVGASLVAQGATQAVMNRKMGLPPISFAKQMASVGVDKSLQVASFAVANTALADQNMKLQKTISTALQEEGKSKETADAAGAFVTNWMLPNLVGMAGGIGMQNHIYSKEIKQVLAGAAAHHKG